jgi:hypothetical protein
MRPEAISIAPFTCMRSLEPTAVSVERPMALAWAFLLLGCVGGVASNGNGAVGGTIGGTAASTGGGTPGTSSRGGTTASASGGGGAGGRAGTGATSSGGVSGSGGIAGVTGTGGPAGIGSGGAVGSGGTIGTIGTGGSTGDTVTWTATDYVSRKWARWPIPNPQTLNLPQPMSYTAAADTVTDNVTGLVWQRSTNAATTDWQTALAYCQSLGAGWSLPTRIELTTIVNVSKTGSRVDAAFTFGGSAGWTWASTPWVVNARRNLTGAGALSWFINFAVGDSNNSLSQTATSAFSRCVRIQPTLTLPALHYTVANGEVTDNYTGLIWQQGHSGLTANLAWDQADTYCKTLTLNGRTWRLPALNEIASIVDDVPTGDVSPAIDHVIFPETSPNLQYWSASPHGTGTTERWTLNFTDGFTAHRATSTLAIARCVR